MSSPADIPLSWWRDLAQRTEFRLRARYRIGLAILAADAALAATPLLTAAWVVHGLSSGTWTSAHSWLAVGLVASPFLLRILVMPIGYARGFESGYAAVAHLRLALLAHLRRLSLGTLETLNSGSLSDLVTNRFRWIEEEAGYGLGGQIGQVAIAFMLVLGLTAIQPVFLVAILALAAALALAFRSIDRAFARLADEQGQLLAESADGMVEFLSGLPVLRTLDQVDGQAGAYRAQVDRLHAFYVRTIRSVAPLVSATRILLDLAVLVLVGLAVLLFAQGVLSASALAVALILLLLLLGPLEASLGEIFRLRLVASAHRSALVHLHRPVLPDGSEPVRGSGEIRFESVRFGYGVRSVFDGLNLVIPEGRTTAIIGRSGAGKSTLLSLIARAFDVEGGRISIGGQDIRSLPLDGHLARLAVVPQEVFLFADSVAGNLRLARAEASQEAIRQAADSAQCDAMIESLPEGYDTQLGAHGFDLSGGERQRLAIARAFLKDAPIILLDEATSALDAENEHGVVEGLEALFAGRTVVMVSHRLRTIAQADHVVVLDQGRIVDSGPPRDLDARCPLYRELWNAYLATERWRFG